MLSLESRRSAEIEKLIRARGGEPFVAPSMREVPLSSNLPALQFADHLFAGDFDMAVFLTGVGARILNNAIELRHPPGAFQEALREIPVVVRGPKPSGVMREWKVPIAAVAKEPNTWRELLDALDAYLLDHPAPAHVAIQEYGRIPQEFLKGLEERRIPFTRVPVYQWDLPEDTAPLREAVRRLARSEFDVAAFTTSAQVDHLFRIAQEEQVESDIVPALKRMAVISIGPTTSEALQERGIPVDLEPSHPRMGIMIAEAAEQAHEILARKR